MSGKIVTNVFRCCPEETGETSGGVSHVQLEVCSWVTPSTVKRGCGAPAHFVAQCLHNNYCQSWVLKLHIYFVHNNSVSTNVGTGPSVFLLVWAV